MDELAVSATDSSQDAQDTLGTSSLSHKSHAELWVDRYRPQQYTDLLGDDRVHREVLAWVKEWDYCVFGKSKAKQKMVEDGQHFDEYKRPREKVSQPQCPLSPLWSSLSLPLAVVNFWSTWIRKDNAGARCCKAGRVQSF